MAVSVLFLGGSGEISQACVDRAVELGHKVTVFNRGNTAAHPEVESVVGDVREERQLQSIAKRDFDVVCQFLTYTAEDAERDAKFFAEHCGQFIFISTASAYQKPWYSGVITEHTPLANPFMAYSRNKIACEHLFSTTEGLPTTIVRPSHTYRTRLPSILIPGDHLLWRILQDKPALVPDEGATLWTLTHATDFAHAFCALFGRHETIGESFHITDSNAHSWREIYSTIAAACGKDLELVSVASNTLADAVPDWRGPLLGDKANSLVFDNAKIHSMVDGWQCQISLAEGIEQSLKFAQERLAKGFSPEQDELVDRLIRDYGKVMGTA